MIYPSIGAPIVDWVYGKQIDGKLKWLPSVGETSGFVWMAVIDLSALAGLIALVVWAL